ncbi:MAG: molybdopterin-guanine dinucleotide biosynthesis protein B [Pseudomonadota bacterium]|nr:molybdopterin-guanine dinucleotide biosynthesis protein B [Pseudomonadota bacterium]
MQVLGVAGWSGSGKTTLITRLIGILVGYGITVSTIKHAHHEFDVDKKGKDSFEHRMAGAHEVLVGSAKRWALMHELRRGDEPSLEELLEKMSNVDLVLVEGFKFGGHEKIEVYRAELGKPLLCTEDSKVVAVVTDANLPFIKQTLFRPNDAEGLARFVASRYQRVMSDYDPT